MTRNSNPNSNPNTASYNDFWEYLSPLTVLTKLISISLLKPSENLMLSISSGSTEIEHWLKMV